MYAIIHMNIKLSTHTLHMDPYLKWILFAMTLIICSDLGF